MTAQTTRGEILATAAQIKVSRSDLDQTCINAIRVLTIDAVQKANSGHCGLPMGMAPASYLLYTRFMRHNPKNAKWFGRDRFVLSAGHGSMLLYSLLYLTGYDISLDDIKQFRQLGSKTPGHPEYWCVPGVETTTGPLGQGFGNGVGMAMAAKHLEARFERDQSGLFDHRIFAICSDGDLMEGVASEAASIAGHLGLGNIVYLYDDNHVTIDGHTELTFDEDVCQRFDAYKWHTQVVEDANDLAALSKAIENGIAETTRPSLIRVRSIIGYGSPHKQGTSAAHSNPLGVEEVKLTKEFYGYPTEPPFYVPDDALAHFRECVERGEELEREWSAKFGSYAKKNPALAGEFQTALAKELPKGWDAELPVFTPKDSLATRVAASQAEAAIGKKVWNLFGGSADLNESTFTDIKDGGDFERGHYDGRNPHFGIREHGMCSISERPRAAWRIHPVRLELPVLHRLRAAVDSAGRADGTPGGVRLHPRLDRCGRGRPDPPADRAPCFPARNSASHCDSPRRRERGGGGVAHRHDAYARPGAARAVAAEGADA